MTSKTLMAQAVADAIGATKRQVQVWTDAGAIHCLPETDRQGRGHQRLYDLNELPLAALVATMARHRLPIGIIREWADSIRYGPVMVSPSGEKRFVEIKGGRGREWVEAALRGEFQSFLIFCSRQDGDDYMWLDNAKLLKSFFVIQEAGLVIAVHKVVNRIRR